MRHSPAGVFLVKVWWAPLEGSDGTDEEMVADEEIGDGASPAWFRNAAMECDFLCCEWIHLADGPLTGDIFSPSGVFPAMV